ESHLKRWFQGHSPRQQLLNEPQMQPGPRPLAPLMPSSMGAASSFTGLAPLVAPPGSQPSSQGNMAILSNMPLVPITGDKVLDRPAGMVMTSTPSLPSAAP